MTEETFEEFEREARRRFPNQPSLRPSAPARISSEYPIADLLLVKGIEENDIKKFVKN